MSTRRYQQRARAEEAEKTRRRIVDAVVERLRDAPSEPVSVERIADMAGVARSTVYAIFGSRAGLFDAVGQELGERVGYRPARRGLAPRRTRARPCAAASRAASEMLAGERDIYRALHSMAKLDEEAVGGAVARREEERAAAMARIAAPARRAGRAPPRRQRRTRPTTCSG